MHKKIGKLVLWIGLSSFLITLWTAKLSEAGKEKEIPPNILQSVEYREQNISEEMYEFLKTQTGVGQYVGTYLLESQFGYEPWDGEFTQSEFSEREKEWKNENGWDTYLEMTEAIWNDVRYFPVPAFTADPDLTVTYVNTWMSERTFGGKRGHEGTDIIASKNVRGLYPIVSMTDGIVTKKGWLTKGGYRIGVTAPGGAYFYYAHLDSYANLEIGDSVKAGDILGFMGDSGYGEEGTVGQFAVHLHLGIYIYPDGKEVSVNPYWVLRYIENKKVKCYNEM